MILAGAASTYVFYTYLAPILADVVGLDAAGSSFVLLLFGAACVGSNLLSGWIAGRFGLRALPVAFAAHAALLALLAVSLPAGVVSIANILAVGLLMYVMNSTVQMLFQNVARADYPSALTFSASQRRKRRRGRSHCGNRPRAEVARALSRRQTLRKGSLLHDAPSRSMPADNTAKVCSCTLLSTKTASNAKKWLTKACN